MSIKDLFLEALSLPPAARPGFLAAACPDDPATRETVARLLSCHGRGAMLSQVLEGTGLTVAGAAELDLPEVLGPYRIREVLGWGGMGVVYRCVEVGSGREMAVKVLHAGRHAPLVRRRFEREAGVLRRLEHPGIARFEAAGVLELPEGTVPYVAMEYVPGRSLREAMRQEMLPTPERRVEVLASICEAIAYAHAQGVVHRDLKPENIQLDGTGRPRVLDFGVAQLTAGGTGDSLETQVGQLLGTMQYMSPEQAEASGAPVDGRADIYALGVMGYELLAGRLPYEVPGDNLHRAVAIILTAAPPPLGKLDRRFRGGLEAVIARAMAGSPEERYRDAATMASDLRALLRGEPVSVTAPRSSRRAAAGPARVLPGAALLLAAVVALGIWRPEAFHPSGVPAAASSSLPTLYGTLDEVDKSIHKGGRSPRELREAITALKQVRADLGNHGDVPWIGHLQCLTDFRLGEAYYFLGDLESDPEAYRSAQAFWWQSKDDPLIPGALAGLDSSCVIRQSLGSMRHFFCYGGVGLAEEALGFYENPLYHALHASGARSMAYAQYTDPLHPAWEPGFTPPPVEQAQWRAVLLNDMATGELNWAALADSVALLNRALRYLAEADTMVAFQRYPDAYAAYLHEHGIALRVRAELTGSPTDAAAAEGWFMRALAIRTASAKPHSFIETRSELARLRETQARQVDAARAASLLQDALEQVRLAGLVVRPDEDPMRAALLALQEAGLRQRLALAQRNAAGLARADSLLADAGVQIKATRYPVQYAELIWVRGRIHATRWRLAGGGGERAAAEEAWRTALAVSPRESNPHFYRLVTADLAALETTRVETAGR